MNIRETVAVVLICALVPCLVAGAAVVFTPEVLRQTLVLAIYGLATGGSCSR